MGVIRGCRVRRSPSKTNESSGRSISANVFAEYYAFEKGERDKISADLPNVLRLHLEELAQQDEEAFKKHLLHNVEWSEIHILERKLLEALPIEKLRRRAWELRTRYARLIGPEKYQIYLHSQPPGDSAAESELRSDLSRLLSLFHMNYSMALVREKTRRRIAIRIRDWMWFGLLVASLLLVALEGWRLNSPAVEPQSQSTVTEQGSEPYEALDAAKKDASTPPRKEEDNATKNANEVALAKKGEASDGGEKISGKAPAPASKTKAGKSEGTPETRTFDWASCIRLLWLIVLVVILGVLGSCLSSLRRLQTSDDRGDPVLGALGLAEFNNYKSLSFATGAVSAFIFWLILRTMFLEGNLFPAFAKGSFFPAPGAENWARLCIWSFLAGFAERLVPDTLDRLVNTRMGSNASVTPTLGMPQAGGARAEEEAAKKDKAAREAAEKEKAEEEAAKKEEAEREAPEKEEAVKGK